MGLFQLTVCLLIAPALATGTSLLQTATSRGRTLVGLRYSPQDPAARTLLTLDTNSDGQIDPSEVAIFAQSQDLDAAAATKEFNSMDTNSDGLLDSAELLQVLGAGASTQLTETEAAPTKVSPARQAKAARLPTAPSTASLATAAAAVQLPSTAAAAAQPPAEQPAKLSPEAATPRLVAMVAAVPVAQATMGHAAPGEQPPKLSAAVATASLDATVPAAQASVGHAALAELSEESRTFLQKAAENVAEELGLEEKEEQQARGLDRKAGEARANSTALVKHTAQDALDAGLKAAHAKADELIAKMSKLEDQAVRAEVRASALRAKSKMEMEEGQQLMTAAKQALLPKRI